MQERTHWSNKMTCFQSHCNLSEINNLQDAIKTSRICCFQYRFSHQQQTAAFHQRANNLNWGKVHVHPTTLTSCQLLFISSIFFLSNLFDKTVRGYCTVLTKTVHLYSNTNVNVPLTIKYNRPLRHEWFGYSSSCCHSCALTTVMIGNAGCVKLLVDIYSTGRSTETPAKIVRQCRRSIRHWADCTPVSEQGAAWAIIGRCLRIIWRQAETIKKSQQTSTEEWERDLVK